MRRCDMYKTGIQSQCQENISAKQQNAGRGHSLCGFDSATLGEVTDLASAHDPYRRVEQGGATRVDAS